MIFWTHSWTWSTSWTVDKSNSWGPHDAEGWYYGPSFERLSELIQKRSGAEVSTKTSTVRRRRWVRTMTCSSKDVLDQIALRVEKVNISRKNIELAISEKQNSLQSIMFYEENRAFVFDQSLSLATQGTVATLAVLKDLFFKLKRLHEVILFLWLNLYLRWWEGRIISRFPVAPLSVLTFLPFLFLCVPF